MAIRSDSFGAGSYPGSGRFHSTAWSMILGAQQGDEATSRRCLEFLMQRYWPPVYRYVQRLAPDAEGAKDITQGFFASFLERGAIAYADQNRGRFRNFLVASVRRYMQQQHRAARARPGATPIGDLEASSAGYTFFLGAGDEDPARTFMKNWAKSLVETCLMRLREECRFVDKDMQYEVFRRRFLGPEDERESHRTTAAEFGITEKDVSNLLERAKRRFARILRGEVQNSMLPDGNVEDEIRELIGALGSG